MKKKGLLVLITSLIMAVALGVSCFFLVKQSKKLQEAEKKRQEQELDIFLEDSTKEVFDEREITALSLDMKNKNPENVYTTVNTQVQDQIVKKNKKKNLYDFESPMWIWDLYGTNHLSLYTYFKTTQPVYIRYTIQVEDANVPNFTRTLKNDSENNLTREHEYELVGFVPGMKNLLIMQMFDEKDQLLNRKVYSIDVPKLSSKADWKLSVSSGRSEEQVTNGLYTVFEDKDILLYDNSGVVRGEIPLKKSSTQSLILEDSAMYYAISDTQIVKIGNRGEILGVYNLGKYKQYGELKYNGYGKLWILATKSGKSSKSVRDTVISLDLSSKKVSELFCMEDLLPKMERLAKKNKKTFNWIDLNAMTQINSDEILVSSRELSSIFKVVKINSRAPRISYIIGEKQIWQGTIYEKKLLKKEGQKEANEAQKAEQASSVLDLGSAKEVFYAPFGQTWMEKETDGSLTDGQYYIYVWDSNYGNSPTRKDIKWASFDGVGTEKKDAKYSYIRKYMVDENTGLYNLMDTQNLPYTKSDGSLQFFGEHQIKNYGCSKEFGEYDKSGQLLRKFKHGLKNIINIEKIDFKDFWFR